MAEPLNPFPPAAPPQPTVSSQFEWDRLSPEKKAQAIADFEKFWLGRSTPPVSAPVTSGAPIEIPVLPGNTNDQSPSTANWRGPDPTPDELRQMEIWNKY